MHTDLPGRPSLVIISDTAMYHTADGVAIFEPTLREIEQVAVLFDKVHWVGYDYGKAPLGNMRTTTAPNLTAQPLRRNAGDRLRDKMGILFNLGYYIRTVNRAIDGYQLVHTRAPSLPAMLAIVRSLSDNSRVYWHKYAGSWVARNSPFTYRIQRWLVKRAKNTIVTINGKWPGQQPHVHTFENPCFTDEELSMAKSMASAKRYDAGLTLCFVGRTEAAKGLDILLEALPLLQEHGSLEKIYIVGDGPEAGYYRQKASSIPLDIEFTGALNREELNKIYAKSHIFCLPSVSEGFPKVLSEAASFGCVPVVTSVSSITQYIDGNNGIILGNRRPEYLASVLDTAFRDRDRLKNLAANAVKVGELFTYDRYVERIRKALADKLAKQI